MKQIIFSQYWDECFDKNSEWYLKYLDLIASVELEERTTDVENGYEGAISRAELLKEIRQYK